MITRTVAYLWVVPGALRSSRTSHTDVVAPCAARGLGRLPGGVLPEALNISL